MIKRIVLLAMAVALNLPATASAADADVGVINGQLINGTAGGSVPTSQTLTLTTYVNDAPTGASSAQSDADGRFTFKGLATAPSFAYDIKVKYQGADYVTERLGFGANETEKFVPLNIYESTSSPNSVSVAGAFTLISSGQDGLQILEHFVFTNTADRAFTGTGVPTATGARRTVRLPLPEGATDLQFLGGLSEDSVLPPDGGGFYDTSAILPGDQTIIYSYTVTNSGLSYTYSRNVDYPTVGYNFLVQGLGTKVSSSKLIVGEPLDFQGVSYTAMSGSNLAAGDVVEVQLSNIGQSGSTSDSSSSGPNTRALLWIAAVVVLLGAGVLFIQMMKRRNPGTLAVDDDPEDTMQGLLLRLAQLDDDFEAGKIEGNAYSRRRAETKSQLVSLMNASRGRSSAD